MQQSSFAALLPPEILVNIFSHSGVHQIGYLEHDFFGHPHRRGILRSLILVCAAWRLVASVLLYEHAYVSDADSLKLFFRTIKSAVRLVILVRTFTYRPRKSVHRKWIPGVVRDENNSIVATVALLTEVVALDIKMTEPFVTNPRFLEHPRLTALHIISVGFRPFSLCRTGFELAGLRSLTLEFADLNENDTWPQLPLLRELRLISVVIRPYVPFLFGLTRLELLHVHFVVDTDLRSLLSTHSHTLEHLSLIGVKPQSSHIAMLDLKHLSKLRTACFGHHSGPIPKTFFRLPPSLVELTILENERPEHGPHTSTPSNYKHVLEHLTKNMHELSNLKVVRIRGSENSWEGGSEAPIANGLRRAGVSFHLMTFAPSDSSNQS